MVAESSGVLIGIGPSLDLTITQSGYPILLVDIGKRDLTKREYEAIIHGYLGQHYCEHQHFIATTLVAKFLQTLPLAEEQNTCLLTPWRQTLPNLYPMNQPDSEGPKEYGEG